MFNAHFETWIMFIQQTMLCNMRSENNCCQCSVFRAFKNETRNTDPQQPSNSFHLLKKFIGFLKLQVEERLKKCTTRKIARVRVSHSSKVIDTLLTVKPCVVLVARTANVSVPSN